MKNPYVRLVIRMSAVLIAVLLVSKLHAQDEQVLAQAGVGLLASAGHTNEDKQDSPVLLADADAAALKVTDEPEKLSDRDKPEIAENNGSKEPDVTAAPDMSESMDSTADPKADAGDTADSGSEGEPADTDSADATDTSDNPEVSGSPDEPVVTDEPDEPVGPDPNDPTLYAGLSELDAALLHASLDPGYRETGEYIAALLVTHPDHYNEAIVQEAHSMPLESNDARYEFLTGKGYKAYTTKDMPDGFRSESRAAENMATFDVPVWKMSSSGRKYSTVWSITIHEKLAASVRCIFSDIYLLDIKFPFNYLNGFMYRKVGGSGLIASPLMSIHAFGSAIDINYWDEDNDYYLGKGNDLRDKSNPYCIPDEVIEIFASYGWFWGGNFDICADTMHFQYLGLEFLQYDTDEPFPILYRGAEDMNETYINNLAKRLVRLGYLENETSRFSKKVDAALKAFQEDYGLEPDGIADYETWVPLINATHDMSYVF